ncbi:hypothetical protein MMC07_004900 [Pseudocyphellaria aurata]|nr:hypothetical protein [Pseudocyphellaria aurata]
MATGQSSTSLPTSGEYSGEKLVIFTICFIPVQIFCVALRFFSRYLIRTSWGPDDVLVATSLLSQLCMAGISIGSVKNAGVGYHVPYLQETAADKLTLWGKYFVAISILYFASFNIPKLAILALYRRLFPQKHVGIAIYVLMGVLIAQTISIVVAAFAACRPFAANWDPTMPGAICIDKEPLFIWSSFPNIVTDIIMLVLPIRIVWNLHISQRLKVGLTLTFMVGSLGFITAIVRFTTFFRKNSFIDGTWSAVDLIIWTQIEAGIYLISACLLECIGQKSFAAMSTYRRNPSGHHNLENMRNGIHDTPLKSVSKIRVLGNSSVESSQAGDTPAATDPRILVTTDIHMKWDVENEV